MDKIKFRNGIIATPQLLNTNTDSLEQGIKNTVKYTRTAGVLKDASHIPVIWTDKSTLGIYPLNAVDIYGNMIQVPGDVNSETPYESGLLMDAEGKLVNGGNALPADRSWLLCIRYAETLGAPYGTHVVSHVKYPVGVHAEYALYLRDISATIEGDIVLGLVYTNDAGVITVDNSICAYSKLPVTDVVAAVRQENASGTSSYEVTFEEHVNDFNNPHNVTAEQLGIDIGDIINHQAFMHDAGIRTENIDSTTSALYPEYHTETQDSANEYITIQPLNANTNEFVVVDGITIYPKDLGFNPFEIYMQEPPINEVGYYLIFVDSATKKIKIQGGWDSEEDDEFLAFLSDKAIFPICSFKWDYETYLIDGVETGSYNIITSTWKDRRIFKNFSVKDIHPDEILALSQFVPNFNSNYQIYNARLVGAVANPQNSYPVSGKYLTITVDGRNDLSYTINFVGGDTSRMLPMSEILHQIWEATKLVDDNGYNYYELYSHLNSEGQLVLCGPISLNVTINNDVNNAASILGFTGDNNLTSSDTIKEVLISGEIEGKMEFEYGADDTITTAKYWFGGNKLRVQNYVYRDDQIIRINESVEQL